MGLKTDDLDKEAPDLREITCRPRFEFPAEESDRNLFKILKQSTTLANGRFRRRLL